MNTIKSSRRSALKILLAGSVASVGTACTVLQSLPRGQGGSSTDGQELSLEVRDALRNHPDTSTLSLTVSSADGEVILKGFVGTDADMRNVEIIANRVAGVRHVIMDIYVR